MADARPFHWEYRPEPVEEAVLRVEGGRPLIGTVPISGAKNAALKLLAAATLTGERCRFTNVPEIEDVRVMADTLRDLGVVVDHPSTERLRGRLGRRGVAVRAARGGGQDAGQLHPARAAPRPVRPGHHQQPRRRPDRPAAGEPPRRRDARAGRRDRVPERLLLRPGAGPAARRGGPLPVRVGHGHRERAARRGPGRRPHRRSARPPRSRRSTTSSRSSRRWAPRSRGPRPTRSRSRGASGCAAPSTASCPTGSRRARSSSPPRSPAATSTLEGAPCEHLGAFLDVLEPGGRRRDLRQRPIEVRGAPLGQRRVPGDRHRDGRRTRASPPTSSRRRACCSARPAARAGSTRRSSRTAWSSSPSSPGWAPRSTIADNHHASIGGPTRLHGEDVEIGDLRAGASLILAALAAEGTTTIHGAHHVHRGYENIERKFLDLGARIERISEPPAADASHGRHP